MTELKQRAMRIISVMPEAEVEKFVSINFRLEPEYIVNDRVQSAIDDDIEKTQNAIADGCDMLSVEESYNRLRKKYGF